MKVMIIDNEEVAAKMLGAKIEGLGHVVGYETNKEQAIDKAVEEQANIFFVDPMPANSVRQFVLTLRRRIQNYPYIFAFSADASFGDAVQAGANDIFHKPLDPQELESKMKNAEHLINLVNRISDDSEDFPSAGGVIAKSAFNQLFLSALERADRYAERTYILFISINNYQEILELDGAYSADYAVARLSQYLVRLRRQSDVIAQTAKHEYALLLQRPIRPNEPQDAANRFTENLAQCEDIASNGSTPVEIKISLIDVPAGHVSYEQVLRSEA